MPKKIDKHHLLWVRTDWSKGYAHALRGHWYFATDIPRETLHAQIHAELPNIPVPSGQSAKDAYEQVVMLESYGALHKNDPIEKRLRLLIMLFDCTEPKTAEALKRQLDIVRRFNKKAPR